MSKKRLKHIAPLRFGIILAIIVGFIGLLVVPFLLLAGAAAATQEPSLRGIPWLFFGGGVAVMPLVSAVAAFLTGVFLAMVYNLAVRWTGGIEYHVEDLS